MIARASTMIGRLYACNFVVHPFAVHAYAPGAMAKKLDYNATLSAREDLTDVLAVYKVTPDSPIPDGRWFIPGQYLTLGLNNEVVPELGSVRRAMSIASPPQQRGTIDFYVRYVNEPESDNPLTHLLWKLKPGDRLNMTTRAVGKFNVDDTIGADDKRLRVLVAAGTGLAPFTSMVESELAENPNARLDNYALLHGSSYEPELGYKQRLERLAVEHGLRYLPTISRPQTAPNWTGATGRVEDFFKAERLDETERLMGLAPGELRPDRAVIYICGLMGTIAMTVERTLCRGFVPFFPRIRKALGVPESTKSTVYYEQYDNTPVVDVNNPDEVARLKAMMPAS